MPNKVATTIMIVDLSVDPARQTEFDDFYHDVYIPAFLKAVPEVVTARRYAQIDNAADSDPSMVHYLTVYELDSDSAPDKIEAAIERSAHKEASDQFKLWKQDGLTYFDRAYYCEVYRHPRQPENGSWDDHFLYALRWTEKGDLPSSGDDFNCNHYFHKQMSKIPSWLGCRTYMRMHFQPPSFLTVFEAKDRLSLYKALLSDDETLSDQDRDDFIGWVEKRLNWHDCLMLEPIYYHSN